MFSMLDDTCSSRPDRFGCQVFVGRRRVAAAASVVESLRQSLGVASDMTTNMFWFMSRMAVWQNSPLVVVLEKDNQPAAAVLLYGKQKFGVPTGVIKGGSRSGDGLVIAAAGQRVAALEAAAGAVLALPWVHTILASMRGATEPKAVTPETARIHCAWHTTDVSTDLSLEGGFEGFLSRLRPRSRRNYYYFRRRAERELGVVFVPDLLPEDAAKAVEELHGASMYSVSRAHSIRLEAAIRQTPGYFAMGVRDAAGQWLSYLSGWRQPEGTYVEWQLNRDELQAASLSTVMRTYFLEHEAAHGVTRVVFVGGLSAALGRYCAPDSRLDLLATRRGIRGRIGRELVTRLRPQGQVALMLQSAALVSTKGL